MEITLHRILQKADATNSTQKVYLRDDVSRINLAKLPPGKFHSDGEPKTIRLRTTPENGHIFPTFPWWIYGNIINKWLDCWQLLLNLIPREKVTAAEWNRKWAVLHEEEHAFCLTRNVWWPAVCPPVAAPKWSSFQLPQVTIQTMALLTNFYSPQYKTLIE